MATQLQIAIDGPVAAGKSTLAKLLAKKLKLTYIDTGAMYRCVALAAHRAGISFDDEAALAELAEQVKIRLARPVGERNDGRTVTVYLDDEDVSWAIRQPEIGEGASKVSRFAPVRSAMVALQQELAASQPVVMEGRDIGTVVLPQAQLKIFLTADLEVRADRKLAHYQEIGSEVARQEIVDEIKTRDHREMTRQHAPLKPATDAWVLDTSALTLEEVADQVAARVAELT